MSDRIEELKRLVQNGRADVASAERAVTEHNRGLHLARTILADRERELKRLLEDEERR